MPIFEVSIRVELPEDFGSFQSAEQKIFEATREGGKELLAKVFAGFEDHALARRPFQKKDRRQKTYHTRLGTMRFKRWRAKDVFAKKQVTPLDAWLCLEGRQKMTSGLCDEVVRQCVDKPYRRANADVERITGVKLTAMGTWKFLQRHSMSEQKKEVPVPEGRKNNLPPCKNGFDDPCPILGIDPDETYVRPRRKTDKSHSLKMAVIYTGRKIVNPNSKNKKRRELVNKQVIIGKVDGSAPELFSKVVDRIARDYGAHQQTRVLCHGDGDPWIKQLKNYYLPQTLNRLDPYHVFEKMRQATGAEKNPDDWVKDFFTNPESLIVKVTAFKNELADSEDRGKVEKFVGYLTNNLDGMRPSGVSKEIKERYPNMYRRGSGTIESNVYWAICQRFKMPRMAWSALGLENLRFLRERFLNNSVSFRNRQENCAHRVDDKNQEPQHMQEWRAVIRDW